MKKDILLKHFKDYHIVLIIQKLTIRNIKIASFYKK